MSADQLAAVPFAILWAGAATMWAGSRVVRPDGRAWSALAATLAAAAALAVAVPTPDTAFGGTLRRDGAVVAASLVILAATSGSLLLHVGRIGRGSTRAADAAALSLLAASGALLTAGAGDLVVAFIGAELMSIPLYGLCGLVRAADRPHAAAIGQVVHGGVATAVLAFGVALVHAGTGGTALADAGRTDAPLALAGTALVLAALGHRALLIPFHPSGAAAMAAAPTYLSALVVVVPRTAVLALLFRVCGSLSDPAAAVDWRASFAVIAAMAVLIADLGALRQRSLRGLIAYGALSQGAYALVALAAGVDATTALIFLLVVGAAATVGSFGAVARLGLDEPRIADATGLARRRPLVGATLIVLLLALAGLPPTGGFVAKLLVLEAAMRAQLAWLVILGALTSAISATAYLRVVFACLEEGEGAPVHRWSISAAVVVAAAGVVVVLGVAPWLLVGPLRGLQF
ncbi:MAG TPA: proton-conducting transporter membrane subunit [Candidatus Limnocylindria bacterium]|nr:proton-conducting transporter membrane subunit [Candidatus Limnocylindria bacterium]